MTSTLNMLDEHRRILWALMLRELATRYGRNNLGFLWVLAEPMVFGVGVLFMYRAIRGDTISGVDVLPFILTGYMPTILTRHIVLYSLNAVKINNSLLYHRSITTLDLFLARIVLEFIGVTFGATFIYFGLVAFGFTGLPANLGWVYEGWFITAFVSSGMALIVGGISEIFEVVERIVGITLYILVPLSGTFFMADWLPPNVRHFALLLPFLNCSEMIRFGFFGTAVTPHFNANYTIGCAVVMNVVGLLLVRQVRDRAEIQ